MTCQYCNFNPKRGGKWLKNATGAFCASELSCFNRLLRQNRAMRGVGGRMSNVCFNLSQQRDRVLTSQDYTVMSDLRQHWDVARRSN